MKFSVKIISALIIIAHTPLFGLQSETGTEFINSISQMNMNSFPWKNESWEEHDWAVYLKKVNEMRKNPKARDKRSSVFSFLIEAQKKQPTTIFSVFNEKTTWSDLNLFCGESDKSIYLGNVLDKTALELGTASLLLTLAAPTDDISVLQKRQEISRFFIEHPQLADKLHAILAPLSVPENVMLSLWQSNTFKHATKQTYFSLPGFKWLNNYRHILLLKHTLEHAKRISWIVSGAVGGITLLRYALHKATGMTMSDDLRIKGEQHQQSSFANLLSLVNVWPLRENIVEPLQKKLKAWNDHRAVASLSTTSAGILLLIGTPSTARWERDNFIIDDCVHQQMTEIAAFLKGMERVYNTICSIPELAQYQEFRDLITFFETTVAESKELQELFWLLEKNTFKGQSSIFSHKGNILRAFKLLQDNKEKMMQAMIALGNIDKWLAIARLYQEAQDSRTPFCFVQYDTAEKPYLDLQNFWHPLIDPKKVVLNSITVGIDGNRPNIIVTGPNAGGKSTTLKAIAISTVMAQTLGIAPAQSMRFTPFSFIASYLNITDDVGAGNSLFKAEVQRTDKLMSDILALPDGQHSFVIFDEIFNGTSPLEGMACAYSVAKHLGSIDKNICLLATHFKPLTNLEKNTTTFTNYKVSVSKTKKTRSIRYPYKLEKGISDQHVAIDILRSQGFKATILNDAQDIVRADGSIF